jgi:hypothetical protein
MNNTKQYHTIETHDFHIKRYKHCPYCELGSKAVPKAEIKKQFGDRKDE